MNILYNIDKELVGVKKAKKEISENDLKRLYIDAYDVYLSEKENNSLVSNYVERKMYRIQLAKENLSFTEISKKINEKYGFDTTDEHSIDLGYSMIYIGYKLGYLYINEINKSIVEGDRELLERTLIRISLWKEGWNKVSIENFIKRLYKKKWEYMNISLYYFYIGEMLGKYQIKVIGRPKLSPDVKEIVKKYDREKCARVIRKKYDISRDLDGLFTEDDIREIKNKIQDISVLNKIDTLSKYCKKNR